MKYTYSMKAETFEMNYFASEAIWEKHNYCKS